MLLRYIKDIIFGSADVQTGTTGPFLTTQTLDPVVYIVGDNSPTTPAAVGKVLVLQTASTATYPGVSQFITSATAAQPVGRGMAGVVTKAAVAVGSALQNEATIVVEGYAKAYATTGSTAITVGLPLVLDGAGNLTTTGGTPAAGTVVAFAGTALAANTTTPTLISVYVGGY